MINKEVLIHFKASRVKLERQIAELQKKIELVDRHIERIKGGKDDGK